MAGMTARYTGKSSHTLANALADIPLDAIARSPTRHLLTQSFRSREFMAPDVLSEKMASGTLLLATDGFWAELSGSEQEAFLGGGQSAAPERDDRSVLQLWLSAEEPSEILLEDGGSTNFYARTQAYRNNLGAISHGRRDNLWATRCRIFQTSSLAMKQESERPSIELSRRRALIFLLSWSSPRSIYRCFSSASQARPR